MSEPQEATRDEKRWAMLAHALTLAGWVIPLANLLFPALVGWSNRESAYVRFHARASLRFQTSCLIYELLGLALMGVCYLIFQSQLQGPWVGAWLVALAMVSLGPARPDVGRRRHGPGAARLGAGTRRRPLPLPLHPEVPEMTENAPEKPPLATAEGSDWPAAVVAQERHFGALTHLSPFIGSLLPVFGSFVVTLFIWWLKRESVFVVSHARASINFQLTMTLYYLIGFAYVYVYVGFGLTLVLASAVFETASVVRAVRRAQAGRPCDYRLSLEFLKVGKTATRPG
jgi:uncharacterized Tic20 family protein